MVDYVVTTLKRKKALEDVRSLSPSPKQKRLNGKFGP
jgi:hypothetical protein